MYYQNNRSLDFKAGTNKIIDLSFLNNGISFDWIEHFYHKINIQNLTKRWKIWIPVHIRNETKKEKATVKLMVYHGFIRLMDDIISFFLLFILKILKIIVDFSCKKLEKYRLEMDYSKIKKEVCVDSNIKRLVRTTS